ncbi:MAG: MATE family efflux transporter [Eubacteriales bacterium]|nr:MATE family efflux transporter [Eubacteriales bacterium]
MKRVEKYGEEEQKKAQEERYRYLTQTPVSRLIPGLAVPTIISMLVTSFYNMADTFFVGKISTQATAAVGIVFSVMSLIQALGFFCGQGSGSYLSRQLGAGNYREASRIASTGFALAFILGGIVTVLGLIFLRPLSILLGATPTILTDTQDYLRIILIGAPIMCSQLVINNQLRFQGAAAYAMVGLVTGALVNIILDPVLIFGLGMGVSGAALATVISQCISFVILFLGSRRGANIKLHIANVSFRLHFMKEIINGGTPSLCRQGLSSISTILLNTAAGACGGDAAIAGMSVVTRVMMFANSALIGFGQGYQPVCAFNYGASLYKRVRDGFWFCVKWGTVFLLVMAVLAFSFAPQIIAFFRQDPDVIAVGTVALRFQACVFPVNAFIVMANMMLQSMGRGVKASIVAASRSGIFFIPFILILPQIFGLTGVEVTQTCADICTVLVAVPLVFSVMRQMKEMEKAGGEETQA